MLNEVPSQQLLPASRAPVLSTDGAFVFEADPSKSREPLDPTSRVLQRINSTFDLSEFQNPAQPFSLGKLPRAESLLLRADFGAPKISDLVVRMPGSQFRVPRELGQAVPTIKRAANFARRINPRCFDEYYCYVTLQQGWVERSTAQRPSPCHVDGLQGARHQPKVRCNHSFIVSTAAPTVWYVVPVELRHLDDAKHNLFYEMDRQVKLSNGANAWSPESNELVLMDCYCIHQGGLAQRRLWRTFLRISFEVRIFDHIDNAHNPLFAYDWPLADRHIGKLGLVRWEPENNGG